MQQSEQTLWLNTMGQDRTHPAIMRLKKQINSNYFCGWGDPVRSKSSCFNNDLTRLFVVFFLKIIKHKRIHEEPIFRIKRLSDLKLSLSLPALYPMRCRLQSVFQKHETLPAKRGVQIPLLPEKYIQLSCPPTPPQPWTREDVCQWDKMSLERKLYSCHQLPFHKGARALPRERATLQQTITGHWVSTHKNATGLCHVYREELRTGNRPQCKS